MENDRLYAVASKLADYVKSPSLRHIRSIVDKLQAEIAKAGRQQDVQAKFAQLGITMTASTPEELGS